jgi:hypothetical protein
LLRKLGLLFFFGNFFYGICTVALSIETSVQRGYPLNNNWYYILLFAATVVYYTMAYINVTVPDKNNIRAVWYLQHRKNIILSQLFLSILSIISVFFLIYPIFPNILQMPWYQWALIILFPLSALLYYGVLLPHYHLLNLRNTGWLKPFVIGFVWSGVVSIYPVMFYCINKNIHYVLSAFGLVLFIKNMMFITVLCIMFDIKDYASDYNTELKTFVVKIGLRKTIFNIMIPLSVIGFGSFLTYNFVHHFPAGRIIINTIPFILLIIVAYSMYQRKPILYYLAIIDGLMLVKAICGIIGSTFFK